MKLGHSQGARKNTNKSREKGAMENGTPSMGVETAVVGAVGLSEQGEAVTREIAC